MSNGAKRSDGGSGPPDGPERVSMPPRYSIPPDGVERRNHLRVDVTWDVDCSDGENFLYSYITNISALGIFISTRKPLPQGSPVTLRFNAPEYAGDHAFDIKGEVAWVNPVHPDGENINPGFGVRFTNMDLDTRERLVAVIHAIAYLPGESP